MTRGDLVLAKHFGHEELRVPQEETDGYKETTDDEDVSVEVQAA